MKNKRILIIGVALVLFALVAVVAFAADSRDGVMWVVMNGRSPRLGRNQTGSHYLEVYNSNDYAVRITLSTNQLTYNKDYDLAAGETRHFSVTSGRVSKVVKK